MINVTEPFLPPKEEYQKYIDEIWERNWLTNDGPLVRQLESELCEYLELKNLLYVSSGTMALQLAIKALGLSGEIITTPFSYVATTSSIVWEACQPIFVDIDKYTLNIDTNLIEAAITSKTSAILATHVFGNPCDIDAIELIAKKYKLKVIYDAAHCFGTKYKGKSVLDYGDISCISFHATKVFHTVEGGAIVAKDPEVNFRLQKLRNFGHDGPDKFNGIGINGKNSEFHAAMGIVNLTYIERILAKRKSDFTLYQSELKTCKLNFPLVQKKSEHNGAYVAVILETNKAMMDVKMVLEAEAIYPRRYFYPSLNKLEYITKKFFLPISECISERILCLPHYFDITKTEIQRICQIIKINKES